ncbi:MAG: FAD-dependent oxidoreductase, partial [Pseudomonadota bacterium]
MTAPPPANSPPANLADSVIIIGAGIVGLATAYALSEAAPDLRITIVDKEAGPARHQTGHNSGVIHAGLYYQPGSLKADLCRKGALETVEFCQQHGIAHEVCGKLVVANTELEATRLDAIHERATANGVPTELLTGDEVREREPNIDVARALYSPRTGIVDYGGMCQQLVEILRERGADIRFNTAVEQLTETATGIHLVTDQGVFEASYLIACAGLQADRIAAFLGLNDDFRIVP